MHIGRLLARIGQLEQWFDDMQHGRVVERFREAIEGLPPVLPGSPLILDEALAQIGQLRQRVAQLEAQRGFFPRVWGWWQHARLAGGE